MRITLSFRDEALWREFRAACIRRKTSASQEIGHFVYEQLDTWQREEKKGSTSCPSPHALPEP